MQAASVLVSAVASFALLAAGKLAVPSLSCSATMQAGGFILERQRHDVVSNIVQVGFGTFPQIGRYGNAQRCAVCVVMESKICSMLMDLCSGYEFCVALGLGSSIITHKVFLGTCKMCTLSLHPATALAAHAKEQWHQIQIQATWQSTKSISTFQCACSSMCQLRTYGGAMAHCSTAINPYHSLHVPLNDHVWACTFWAQLLVSAVHMEEQRHRAHAARHAAAASADPRGASGGRGGRPGAGRGPEFLCPAALVVSGASIQGGMDFMHSGMYRHHPPFQWLWESPQLGSHTGSHNGCHLSTASMHPHCWRQHSVVLFVIAAKNTVT
eukprot:1161508-Pelagomonas_calceolata.AAC.13